MGYRLHFYHLTAEELESISLGKTHFYDHKDILCMEMNNAICGIWDHCKPYFRGYPKKRRCEEANPCVVTKANLREMVLAFYRAYQEYIITQSIDIGWGKIPTDKTELFKRCMHLTTGNAEQDNNDKEHARFNGQYNLQQLFLVHCTADGFSIAEDFKNEHFEKLLDDEDRMNDGNTTYDLLVQLIYMYKTYDSLDCNKFLIIAGW